jgi:hypothetical protein
MPTEEQKLRKNEMAKLNRARKKELKEPEVKSENEEIVEVNVKEEPEKIVEVVEDPEVIRKKAIADKRRASLALARTKKKTNSQNTNDELTKIKEENLQLKELAKKEKEVRPIPEVVPKKVAKMYNTPIKQRPKKQVQEQVQKEPSIDYLVDKSYGETLANKLRSNMLQRMMQETFM